jgi:hypothetical protein
VESWDSSQPTGWETEDILFLGVDGNWRTLNMGTLGLPDAWWPGPDTYGAGTLSADGRTWAGRTTKGIVFVDTVTGSSEHIALPARRSRPHYAAWIPGQHAVATYASDGIRNRYSTFRVTPDGEVRRLPYDLSRSRLASNGQAIEIRTAGRRLTMTSTKNHRARVERLQLPRRLGKARHLSWYVDHGSDLAAFHSNGDASTAKGVIWIVERKTGELRAGLMVPAASYPLGWESPHWLRIFVANQHVTRWNPTTGAIERLARLPDPHVKRGEWAAVTMTFR